MVLLPSISCMIFLEGKIKLCHWVGARKSISCTHIYLMSTIVCSLSYSRTTFPYNQNPPSFMHLSIWWFSFVKIKTLSGKAGRRWDEGSLGGKENSPCLQHCFWDLLKCPFGERDIKAGLLELFGNPMRFWPGGKLHVVPRGAGTILFPPGLHHPWRVSALP